MATLGRVSVPPGPKGTVPLGWKTAFEVPAAGVTLMITVMVDTGFTPFFLEPPRVAVVQMNWLPPATADAAVQDPVPPLSKVGVGGLGALIFNPVGTKIAN